jgi:WD40 repeat protein/serine/threonine protein kinase
MNTDWERIKEVLAEAAARSSPAERAAYLDGACRGDDGLRAEVEKLLLAHDQADGFLEEPVAPPQPSTIVLSAPITEKPGDRIGYYKLLQQIGEGGCGVVYMAEQEQPIRRRVALKVIKLGMDTKQVVARFEAERQALALMDHPNIAKVFDAGTTDTGRPYFVMELVRGVKITDYCDENHLSTKARLELFIHICHAIQHAHQKGIIHRDIKPSNILVTINDGVPVPKVIDFGIAKAVSQQLTDKTVFTAFEQFIGTPAYMSPEQALMTSLDIDTRSDIYALGVLLYELLTGHTPLEQKDLLAAGLDQMRRIIREQEPVRPSTRLSTLDDPERSTVAKRRSSELPQLVHVVRGDLDWIVMKCLEKDRTRRYETANGLAHDILCHLNNEPVLARPPSQLYRFQKLVRRNKLVFAAAAVVIGVLVLGVLVSTWQTVRATRARHEAVEARNHEQGLREAAQQAQTNEAAMRERAEKQELEARQRAYASDMNIAKQAMDENNFGHAQELLDRQRPQPGQRDLRGWEWRYLWQQCRSDALFTLCQKSSEVESLAVSQDGQLLAIGQARGGLSVWDLRTQQQVVRLAEGGNVRAVFSPTGSWLAYSTSSLTDSGELESRLHVWNTVTRQMMAEFSLSGACVGLVFSEDGQTLATCTGGLNSQVTVWQIAEGKKLVSYPATTGFDLVTTQFAATRDLHLAAYGLPRREIRVIDLRNGKELWTATASEQQNYVTAIAFSPDGKTLASTAGWSESDIRLWDVASGNEIARLDGHGSCVISMLFWPDGKKLASSSADQTIWIWDVAGRKCLDVLRGHRQEVWRLALLPDHTTLVSGCKDGTVCFWDTSVRHSHEAKISLPERMTDWQFAPDSQSVVTSDLRGRVTRWVGRDFQQAKTLFEIGTNRYPGFDRLSRDGRFLAATTSNNVLQVWDLSRQQLWREFPSPAGRIWAVTFNDDDNKLVALAYDYKSLYEWDLNSSQEIHSWRVPAESRVIAISPDQRLCVVKGYLLGGFSGDVFFEDLIGGGSVQRNLNAPEIWTGAFSPDGKLFAVASFMGYARVWKTTTYREIATLRGYLKGINSVAFSADSKRLATGGTDKGLKLWDTESWQEVLTLGDQGSDFTEKAFSPDGKAIIEANSAGIVHIWRAPSWDAINAAEKSVPAPNL